MVNSDIWQEDASACDVSYSPTQLAGVPDQVPSAWHSLMPVPWRSKSGSHRTPQAASKWLLHTFWMKKPFAGGYSGGQYTTARREDRRTHTHKHTRLLVTRGLTRGLGGKLMIQTKRIRKHESGKLQVVKHSLSHLYGGRKRVHKNRWLMSIIVFTWTGVWKSLDHSSRNGQGQRNYWRQINNTRHWY